MRSSKMNGGVFGYALNLPAKSGVNYKQFGRDNLGWK